MASDPSVVTRIYEQIPLEAMQQVADSYMAWYVDRVTRQLDDTIANLRSELRDNDQKEASFRPSPQELDAIERLQRSGVTGVDLLDRMVEQGDEWLAVTMRRLDHFERTGLAPKDYSIWCEHALGGAYDWIDHDSLAAPGGAAPGLSAPPRPAAIPAPGGRAAPGQGSGGSTAAGSPPDWLAGRGSPRNAAAAGETAATGPVPSMGGTPPMGVPPRPQPAATDGDPDGDAGRRNIFKIFTN